MSHCCQQTVVGWGEGPQQKARVQLSKSNSLMFKAVPALQQSWGGSWGSWGSRGTALLALQWGEVWGVFGALSSSGFAAAPSPSLLAGVLLCTHRHPWVLHAGGDCATTHPVLVSLPAPEVSTLLPHSFIQSFSSAFAAEFPLSHRGNTAALGTLMHVTSPREVRACRTLGPGNAGRGHRQGW